MLYDNPPFSLAYRYLQGSRSPALPELWIAFRKSPLRVALQVMCTHVGIVAVSGARGTRAADTMKYCNIKTASKLRTSGFPKLRWLDRGADLR